MTVPRGASVVVVGGGVVGVSTAFALHRAGYEVQLLTDGAVGEGATSSNGGLLVPADSLVWASPANAKTFPEILLRRSSYMAVDWSNPAMVGWGINFLRNSTRARHAWSSILTHQLSTFSLGILSQWATEGDLDFGFQQNGLVLLYGSRGARSSAIADRLPLTTIGERYEELDFEDLLNLDDGFANAQPDLFGLYATNAGHGDARQFTRQLSSRLQSVGLAVRQALRVTDIVRERGRVAGVNTQQGFAKADAVVLASGHRTRQLARSAGVRLPILPVKGYSVTVPLRDADRIPWVGGILDDVHVAFSRTSRELRLSTGAEFGRRSSNGSTGACDVLYQAAQRLFPHAGDWERPVFGVGHRPMTPNGLPLIGPTQVRGLWVNSGHGYLGWTQAAGSAVLLADAMMGLPTSMDLRPFAIPKVSVDCRRNS